MHFQIYPVLRGNEVLGDGRYALAVAGDACDVFKIGAGASFEFMMKNSAKTSQVYAVEAVEIKVLIAGAHEQFVSPYGVRPLRKNWPEILRRFRYHTQGRVEGEDESRGRRDDRYLADLGANLGRQRRKACQAGSLKVNCVLERG